MTILHKKTSNSDVVACTLYVPYYSQSNDYWKGYLHEIDKIKEMQENFAKAAASRNKAAPAVEVTLYLVPDWRYGIDWEHEEYKDAKEKMLQQARERIAGTGIQIKDFVTDSGLTENEKEFLKDLDSKGSTADLMKTKAIINNKGRKCLQTDSNIDIVEKNYDKLYQKTFGQEKDAYNASRCSSVYISAHNKIVFTSPQSSLPDVLSNELSDYLSRHAKDDRHKTEESNTMYDRVFAKAMHVVGAAYDVATEDRDDPSQIFHFYPANLNDTRYTLMPLVVPNQQESWRITKDEKQIRAMQVLKALPKVIIDDVAYGYTHFKSIVKVYTNIPTWHEKHEDLSEQAKNFQEKFVNSQSMVNKNALKEIFLHVVTVLRNPPPNLETLKKLSAKDKLEVIRQLVKVIPNNKAGCRLVKEVFGCDRDKLLDTPMIIYNKLINHPPRGDASSTSLGSSKEAKRGLRR